MSFNQESKNAPKSSLPGPQDVHFDSGLGGSINQLSGSFEEGYQQLSGSYELEYYDYDQGGPLSFQPASLTLLTTVTDSPSQQVSSDEQNVDSGSDNSTTVAQTNSVSTVARTNIAGIDSSTTHTGDSSSLDRYTTNTDTTCTELKGDSSAVSDSHGHATNASASQSEPQDLGSGSRSLARDRYPPGPCIGNPVHHPGTTTISDTQNEINTSESDSDQDQNDCPSPILSNVRAEAVKVKEIIIRESVVENRPEVISERVLVESARSPSPP